MICWIKRFIVKNVYKSNHSDLNKPVALKCKYLENRSKYLKNRKAPQKKFYVLIV